MSKVSIIIPVYNAEKTLCRCLDSLVVQTYEDVEIILVMMALLIVVGIFVKHIEINILRLY